MPLITIKVDYFCKHFLQVKRMIQVPAPADNRVASPLKKKGKSFCFFVPTVTLTVLQKKEKEEEIWKKCSSKNLINFFPVKT